MIKPSATFPLPPIGQHLPWLAPLAGFSDLPFRLLCLEQGAAAVCTEMVSAKGLIYGLKTKKKPSPDHATDITLTSNGGTEDLLITHPHDTPLVVQLFGAEVSFMEQAVSVLSARGYAAFDINMGCSVPKVTKTGAGAAMLQDIPNAVAITRAMVMAAEGRPVGAKIRLGWSMGDDIYLDLALRLEDAGASWITLHPRYAKQGFTGTANIACLHKLKQHISIPVMASGDLLQAADAVHCLEQTHVDGCMFARGALNNPAIFSVFTQQLTGHSTTQTAAQLYALIIRHASLAKAYTPGKAGRKGIPPALLKMRTFVPRYVRHLAGSKILRQNLALCQGWDHLEELLFQYFQQFNCAPLAITKETPHEDYSC